MGKIKDLTGIRFGRLVAQEIVGRTNHRNMIWRCICDCSRITNVTNGNLNAKVGVKSCGICIKRPAYWRAYKTQSYDAKDRGIEFLLSFEEWLNIWQDSGHLHERGKKKGQYVMARFGDKGPYAVGNVKIITFADNTREACLGVPHSEEHRNKQIESLKKSWAEGRRVPRRHSDEERKVHSESAKRQWQERKAKGYSKL
jgi:hypothetical protein